MDRQRRATGDTPPPEGFGASFARLWQRLRGAEWAAYAEGEPLDRSAADRELYDAASRAVAGGRDTGRDVGPVERIRRRVLVDHHPAVARLRDRVDDWSSYGPLPDRLDARRRRDLAAAMEPDVVRLIELRNALARDLGAASYGHLAMAAEGLDLDAVAAELEARRAVALDEAASIATSAGLTIESWFEGLDRIAGAAGTAGLGTAGTDAIGAARALAARLGCGELFGRIRWEVRDGPLAGWAAGVAIPADVRVLVRPARSARDVATVFHELGHALAYAGTRTTGFRSIPGDTQDETMGAVVEAIGVRASLSADARSRLRQVAVLERARVATSALFEVAIQDEPASARERFAAWYAPLVAVPDPVAWAADSFRSVDPFRIHAYALAEGYAATVVDRLEAWLGDDLAAWGEWLRDELWAPGRRDSVADLPLPPAGGGSRA